MLGATLTVKATPLLAKPLTVTTTFPVVAPAGTLTVMLVALHAEAAPVEVPLNVTELVPWLAPKFVPVIVIGVPTAPELWLKVVMLGATVNATPLLATPPTVTTTFPVLAPTGTLMVMLVALHAVAVPADVPLKVTVLVPWLAPKFVPVTVTAVPTAPEVLLNVVIVGLVLPAPVAALNVASSAPQTSDVPSVALADAVPATICT
jgi:hypothetical protein